MAPWNMVPKQLVSKRLVGKEKKNLAPILRATKAVDLGFMAFIAYSVLFGVLLHDTRVSGELW